MPQQTFQNSNAGCPGPHVSEKKFHQPCVQGNLQVAAGGTMDSVAVRATQASRQKRRKSRKSSLAVIKLPIKMEQEEPARPHPRKIFDPIIHFKHQVAVIRKLIPKPRKWTRFMGSLGTGILGVRPLRNEKGRRGQTKGFVILFLNASDCHLQDWGGKTLNGYTSCMNLQNGTLRWESQRSDVHGRVIDQINQHVMAGTQIVVAVRSKLCQEYGILGYARNFQLEAKAQFMLQPGDSVVAERGSYRVHRQISAQCLDGGLKSGIGLIPYKYPLPKSFRRPNYCPICCFKRSTALMTFDDFDRELAGLLQPQSCSKGPRKRLRGKQPPDGHPKTLIPGNKRQRRWLRGMLCQPRRKDEGEETLADHATGVIASSEAMTPADHAARLQGQSKAFLLAERRQLQARMHEVDWLLCVQQVTPSAVAGG